MTSCEWYYLACVSFISVIYVIKGIRLGRGRNRNKIFCSSCKYRADVQRGDCLTRPIRKTYSTFWKTESSLYHVTMAEGKSRSFNNPLDFLYIRKIHIMLQDIINSTILNFANFLRRFIDAFDSHDKASINRFL